MPESSFGSSSTGFAINTWTFATFQESEMNDSFSITPICLCLDTLESNVIIKALQGDVYIIALVEKSLCWIVWQRIMRASAWATIACIVRDIEVWGD